MKIAYFDCFSGISGDMILGALVDAGVDGDALQSELSKLKLQDYSLNFTKSIKHGITGTKANVNPVTPFFHENPMTFSRGSNGVKILEESESHHHEHAADEHNGEHAGAIHEDNPLAPTTPLPHPPYQRGPGGCVIRGNKGETERSEAVHEAEGCVARNEAISEAILAERSEHTYDKLSHFHIPGRFLNDIFTLIDESSLSQRIKNTAKAIFDRLAAAEAKVHGATKDTVHLHEVSAVDSIVDIVGAVIGIDLLGIEEVYASPISLGSGFIRCSHGVMPVPVPGTLELLVGVPVRQTNIRKELVTPTGAAIITTLAKGFGAMPQMTIDKIGYGAGSRDLEEQPNLLRVIIGEKKKDSPLIKGAEGCYDEDKIIVLETNIDDMSSEIYGYLMEKLFPLGALDVFFTPIFMKKNRPATMLNVLVERQNLKNIIDFIIAETTTFGVRFHEVERKKLQREFITVKTQYGDIPVKIGKLGDEVIKAVPEYEDCKKLAEANSVSVRKVYESAVTQSLS